MERSLLYTERLIKNAMKTIAKICVLMIVIIVATSMMPQKASAQYDEQSYQVFYDQLSPYGMWVDNPDYGYVWVPNVGPGFRPYSSRGYWVMTDFGWTWVSRYSWGWAPFHYGRWYADPMYGWIWVPGNEWGPAWVTWRRCDGYYGWGPMAPGITINMTFGPEYRMPEDHWIFVRERDFGRDDLNRYYINRSENASILRRTAVITNTRTDNVRKVTYIAGPDKNEVQKVSARTVKVLPIRETKQPGQTMSNGQIQLYRPVVKTNTTSGTRPAPGKVVKMQEIKPVSERTNPTQQRTTNPVVQPQQRQNAQPQNNKVVVPQKQERAQPMPQRQAQPQQRSNPQGKTNVQHAPQHNAVQPVHQNQQPVRQAKPVKAKPQEEPKKQVEQLRK